MNQSSLLTLLLLLFGLKGTFLQTMINRQANSFQLNHLMREMFVVLDSVTVISDSFTVIIEVCAKSFINC